MNQALDNKSERNLPVSTTSTDKNPITSKLPASSTQKRDQEKALWNDKICEIQALCDGQGRRIDPGIVECVAGLQLHNLATFQSCEGHDERPGSAPSVSIGYCENVLELTYRGQNEVFDQLLSQISVPLSLRFRYLGQVGIGPLTREKLLNLDTPDFRTRYPDVWSHANQALMDSCLEMENRSNMLNSPPLSLLPEIRERKQKNKHLYTIAKGLVDEFHQQRGLVDSKIAINISPWCELPLCIQAGQSEHHVKEYESGITDCSLLQARQSEMQAFGKYLKDRFLSNNTS